MDPISSDPGVVFKETVQPLDVLFYRNSKKSIKKFVDWEEKEVLDYSQQLHEALGAVYSLKTARDIYQLFLARMKEDSQLVFPCFFSGEIKSDESIDFKIHLHSPERAFIECKTIDTFLGEGVFRRFYSVQSLHHPKKQYAIGFPKTETIPDFPLFMRNCYQEADCYSSLSGSKTAFRAKNFIIYPLEPSQEGDPDCCPVLITRKYAHTFLDVIRGKFPVPNDRCKLRLTKNLLEALKVINGAPDPVVHRDIKPDNLFFNGQEEEECRSLVFADFNCAIVQSKIERIPIGPIPGSLSYLLPEHFDFKKKITPAANVYGVGLVIYTLWSGKMPLWNFYYNQPDSQEDDVPDYSPRVYRNIFLAMEKFSDTKTTGETHPLLHLILKMLSIHPEKRISFQEALCVVESLLEKEKDLLNTEWTEMFRDFTKNISKEILGLSDEAVAQADQWLEEQALQVECYTP